MKQATAGFCGWLLVALALTGLAFTAPRATAQNPTSAVHMIVTAEPHHGSPMPVATT
jgi:hypothetical protein